MFNKNHITFILFFLFNAYPSFGQVSLNSSPGIRITSIDTNYFYCSLSTIIDGCYWKLKQTNYEGVLYVYDGKYRQEKLIDTTSVSIYHLKNGEHIKQTYNYPIQNLRSTTWKRDSFELFVHYSNRKIINDRMYSQLTVKKTFGFSNSLKIDSTLLDTFDVMVSDQLVESILDSLPEWSVIVSPMHLHFYHFSDSVQGRTMRTRDKMPELFNRTASFDILFSPAVDGDLVKCIEDHNDQIYAQYSHLVDSCSVINQTKQSYTACKEIKQELIDCLLPNHIKIIEGLHAFVSEIRVSNLYAGEDTYYDGNSEVDFNPRSKEIILRMIKMYYRDKLSDD